MVQIARAGAAMLGGASRGTHHQIADAIERTFVLIVMEMTRHDGANPIAPE